MAEERKQPRAKIRWHVKARHSEKVTQGVTLSVSSTGLFIACSQPFRLNSVIDVDIEVPDQEQPLQASAEVVWSNIYGPDDDITPRGMGVRFLKISGEARQAISTAVIKHLRLEGIRPDADTIEIAPDQK